MNLKFLMGYFYPLWHRYAFSLAILCLGAGCNAQTPTQKEEIPLPVTKTIKKDSLRGVIVSEERYKMIDKDANLVETFGVYHFYNDKGKEVKTLDALDFPAKHPIYNLNFQKNTKEWLEKERSSHYFKVFYDPINSKPLSKSALAQELGSLNKYGLVVKKPETAINMFYSPNSNHHQITLPARKYLVKIEDATIFNFEHEELNPTSSDSSNTLLDCSYLSIYNNLGNLVKEVSIPDRVIDNAAVSDDGKYLFATTSYNFVTDEGVSRTYDGFVLVNLKTNERKYISIPDSKCGRYNLLFADGLFQTSMINSRNGGCTRFMLNPYKNLYYVKYYPREFMQENRYKDQIDGVSLQQFKGVIEKITDFEAFGF